MVVAILFVLISVIFLVCEYSLSHWCGMVEHEDKIAPCVLAVAVMLIYIGIVFILTSGKIVVAI